MYIFANNSFTTDPLNERTQRFLALKTYVAAWEVDLSIPLDMKTWALAAHGLWVAALGKSSVEMGESEESYQDMQEADDLTYDYYIRCKDLLKDRYGFEDKVLTIYGIKGAFPQARKDKLRAVQNLLDGNKVLTTALDPKVLPVAFITKLEGYLNESNKAFSTYVIKEKPEALKAVDDQNALFNADSKQLRVLYSWALMTWTPYEPYLIQLGFAPRTPKAGKGQPEAPTGAATTFVTPNLTVSWLESLNSTGYQLAWSEDEENWEELYYGTDLSFTYAPPSGLRYYKVRARNAHGYSDWSDVVSYEVPV